MMLWDGMLLFNGSNTLISRSDSASNTKNNIMSLTVQES